MSGLNGLEKLGQEELKATRYFLEEAQRKVGSLATGSLYSQSAKNLGRCIHHVLSGLVIMLGEIESEVREEEVQEPVVVG